MNYYVKTLTALEIVQMLITGKLNPDPIGQRPPVTLSPKKSIKIVRGMLQGYGCGMITIRDIRKDAEAKKIYKCDYLVIDGGHRCRAMKAFYEGRFHVDGKFFHDLENNVFAEVQIPVDIRTCTAKEASVLFKSINTTTPTNFMEMIMSDEESIVCKYIREQTSRVKEYNNAPHPLFSPVIKNDGSIVAQNFDNDLLNPRRRWDEYVAMAIIRSAGKGLVDAGQNEIEELTSADVGVSNSVKNEVKAFLNTAHEFCIHRKKQFNDATFSAFFVYYFGLVGKHTKFAITDSVSFFNNFLQVYTRLTGTQDNSLGEITIEFEGKLMYVKEFVRKNIKNFSNGAVQQKVFELFEQYRKGDDGVVALDKRRSLSSDKREEALAAQGFVCAIDGLPLELKDAVFGHDTPWCKGGISNLSNGAMIRAKHNRDMGTVTLDEYRMILQARGEIAA